MTHTNGNEYIAVKKAEEEKFVSKEMDPLLQAITDYGQAAFAYTGSLTSSQTGTLNVTAARIPVDSLFVEMDDGNYNFTPLDDITAVEVAKLMKLFLIATHASNVDLHGYIHAHQLQRHFTKK